MLTTTSSLNSLYQQFKQMGTAINECLRSVSEWMTTYFLRLNKSNTKILVLAPPSVMSSITIHGAFIDNESIRFVDCAKNLSVWLGKTHVRKVVSSCYKVLHELSKIKSFIPRESLCTLVSSLVLSKLDYCNALYYKTNTNEINMLQTAQNSAIRLIFGRFKYDRASTSHLLDEMHWLKIRERIVFKICLLVHKCIWVLAPESLKSIIVIFNVRTFKLIENKFSTIYGERAFSCAGLKLWNNLPLHIRLGSDTDEFKKLLKSFLVTNSYNFYSCVNMR